MRIPLREFSTPLHNEAMLWEGRPLRDIRETDVRRLVESGLTEHLQLEYRSALYDDSDRGRREFLLDICMFANASGGMIFIGIPELRDEQEQPTGAPDPAGVLGVDVPNPEAVLNAYDARVMEAIEERLPLESASIEVGNGQRVLAIRIPNSANKPHSVRHQGHIYFPSRRERQRYHLTVREIKELVMRTASRMQQAEEILNSTFLGVTRSPLPSLLIGMIPVFFQELLVDVRAEPVRRAVGDFSRAAQPDYIEPAYTFDGLERSENRSDYTVRFHRNGLLSLSVRLTRFQRREEPHLDIIIPTEIDSQLQRFVARASTIFGPAAVDAPYLLGMMLRAQRALAASYEGADLLEHHTPAIPAMDYRFPYTQIDDLSSTDRVIRPLCDQAHQMFGREGSPSFNAEGVRTAQYA